MSDPVPKAKGKLRSLVPSLSGSAWITIGTFCGLLLLTLFTWLLAWRNPLWVPWGTYLTLSRGAALLGLAFAACFAEYLLFRIWFDEAPIPDRDLRAGWTAGFRKLKQEEISPKSLPCFLVIDPADSCERWFDAAGVKVQTPEAAADSPVQWYCGDEALFLVVRGLGCLGPLTRELNEMRRRPSRYVMESTEGAVQQSLERTTGTSSERLPEQQRVAQPALAAAAVGGGEPVTQNGEPAQDFVQIDADAVREELQGVQPTQEHALGLMPERDVVADEWEVSDVRVSSTEISRQSRRLSEVCRRLAACRRPVVPLNGVCVLLPSGLLSGLAGTGVRLGQALNHDLRLLQREFQVAAPVTVLLTGAEEDAGIVELIRRGGKDAAAGGELGLVSSPGRATAEGVRRYGDAFVRTLQQKVGRQLRDPRSVGRPGSERLFRLLSGFRGAQGSELKAFIAQAFGCSDDEEPDVLAGLSLVATGEQPTGRAFARTTFRQLLNNQEFVEWTARGRRNERRLWWFAGACGSLSVLAGMGFVALLVMGS